MATNTKHTVLLRLRKTQCSEELVVQYTVGGLVKQYPIPYNRSLEKMIGDYCQNVLDRVDMKMPFDSQLEYERFLYKLFPAVEHRIMRQKKRKCKHNF